MDVTDRLYLEDGYAREAEARVVELRPGGVVLDRTVLYARSGGQPGDAGHLRWARGEAPVAEALKSEGEVVVHPIAGEPPAIGDTVTVTLDWARRHRHMRMHTAMHLLCSLTPGIGVTGGQIGGDKSRLDFDLPDPQPREWWTERLNALVAEDHPVSFAWIEERELDANPQLVRTLSVQPPRMGGRIRLVRIGTEATPVDLQPCGGTHVRSTGEIGRVTVLKLENKGRQNRRISIALEN
ncbi:MAG TPA: alanyl-tRNA editing protein [Roseococcus sp.]|nr:alanyl-tRNA editing protein [Roseococcus sp.]